MTNHVLWISYVPSNDVITIEEIGSMIFLFETSFNIFFFLEIFEGPDFASELHQGGIDQHVWLLNSRVFPLF